MPQRKAEFTRITGLPQDANALLHQRRLLVVREVAMLGGHSRPGQRSATSYRYVARSTRRGVRQPLKSFAVVHAGGPETAESACQSLLLLGTVRIRLAPPQRRPQVVMLD